VARSRLRPVVEVFDYIVLLSIMMRRWIWILALAAAVAATGYAQMFRPLPANGRLGELTGQQQPYPLLQIGSVILRLAPGGRIYDEHNRIIMHGTLPAAATVMFVQDMNGDVSRVYILTAVELEQIRQRQQQR
jgi:hypothetical protein